MFQVNWYLILFIFSMSRTLKQLQWRFKSNRAPRQCILWILQHGFNFGSWILFSQNKCIKPITQHGRINNLGKRVPVHLKILMFKTSRASTQTWHRCNMAGGKGALMLQQIRCLICSHPFFSLFMHACTVMWTHSNSLRAEGCYQLVFFFYSST